jgi:hypothetical protein
VRRADRPLALALLAVAVSALAALLGPAILRAFLAPLAAGAWLLARALVLSADQAAIWGVILLGAGTLFAFRIAAAAIASGPEARPGLEEPNAALRDIESWRYLFADAPRGAREEAFARRELAALLCSAYAARFGVENDYGLYSGFGDGRVPLPEEVRAYIFAREAPEAARGPGRIPRRAAAWLRRVSGRERAEYLRVVELLIGYIEGGMEAGDE